MPMRTWWGRPWVRWPHVQDERAKSGERLLLIGSEYYSVAAARELAEGILRLLMEDAAAKVKR